MTNNARLPRLTLDIQPLFDTQWTGIPVFARRLAQALLQSGALELEFAANLISVPKDLALHAMRVGSGAYLNDEFHSDDWKTFAPPDPGIPMLYPSNKGRNSGMAPREASTVHDLTTLFMPDTHDEGNVAYHLDHLTHELATNDATFCISESTRASLAMVFPSVGRRARLLTQYVDWPASFALADRNLPPFAVPPFALVIGTIEPRKNLGLLLEAIKHPRVARQGLYFVVLGKQGWLVEGFLERLTPEERARVMFTGYVTEFIKYRLLRSAQFLIFPSLCEGFGIPALEAMSLGKAVLASRSSSLPEVIGDAGIYFDPLSVDEFADALEAIAHPLKRAELAPRALSRSAAFTPQRMAQPVIDWLGR